MECILVSSDRNDRMIMMSGLVWEKLVTENLKKIA